MPQVDLQAALTRMENRLLATEGQIFALKSVIHSAMALDDALSSVMRGHLAGTEAIFAKGIDDAAKDPPTAKFMTAARNLISELLADTGFPQPPRLKIIDGGKPEA